MHWLHHSRPVHALGSQPLLIVGFRMVGFRQFLYHGTSVLLHKGLLTHAPSTPRLHLRTVAMPLCMRSSSVQAASMQQLHGSLRRSAVASTCVTLQLRCTTPTPASMQQLHGSLRHSAFGPTCAKLPRRFPSPTPSTITWLPLERLQFHGTSEVLHPRDAIPLCMLSPSMPAALLRQLHGWLRSLYDALSHAAFPVWCTYPTHPPVLCIPCGCVSRPPRHATEDSGLAHTSVHFAAQAVSVALPRHATEHSGLACAFVRFTAQAPIVCCPAGLVQHRPVSRL